MMTSRSFLALLRAHRRQAREGADPDRTVLLQFKRPVPVRAEIRVFGSDLTAAGEVFRDNVYEVACRASSHRTIIDLGANIGLASLYFASRFPEASILCVEPVASSRALLLRNLRGVIAAGRCSVLGAAVWDIDGASLQFSAQPGEYLSTHMEPAAGEGSIEGLTMAQILRRSGFEVVDLLKVDIEGAEVRLFSGDLAWLDRVRSLAVEFHQNSRQASRFDAIMRQKGFRVVDEGGHTVFATKCGGPRPPA